VCVSVIVASTKNRIVTMLVTRTTPAFHLAERT
jgi:hypothetical protein